VKRPPARYVDIGAAEELMSNASGGFGQEGQDDKEEEIARRTIEMREMELRKMRRLG